MIKNLNRCYKFYVFSTRTSFLLCRRRRRRKRRRRCIADEKETEGEANEDEEVREEEEEEEEEEQQQVLCVHVIRMMGCSSIILTYALADKVPPNEPAYMRF